MAPTASAAESSNGKATKKLSHVDRRRVGADGEEVGHESKGGVANMADLPKLGKQEA